MHWWLPEVPVTGMVPRCIVVSAKATIRVSEDRRIE